jgi:hypothetical protein
MHSRRFHSKGEIDPTRRNKSAAIVGTSTKRSTMLSFVVVLPCFVSFVTENKIQLYGEKSGWRETPWQTNTLGGEAPLAPSALKNEQSQD